MIARHLSDRIIELSKFFPVLLLTGPRQVGKTTLLKAIDPNREYVTLDDMEEKSLAVTDPAMFLQVHKAPMLIDEIQYAPGLMSYIKMQVDKEQKPGDFWLTGSQRFHLMQGVTESLAGRVVVLDLLGISHAEIEGMPAMPFLPDLQWIEQKNSPATMDVNRLFEVIFRGSMPKLVANPDLPKAPFYSSYVRTYIERDVRNLAQVGSELKFYAFLKAAAARTGQLINYADIGADVGIDLKTVQSWVSILRASGIVELLHPYHNNLTKRAVKTPKLYFLDTGLCSYLTGWDSPATLMNGAMNGAILETYIYSEILKSYFNNAEEPSIYFYRDTDRNEIDFVLEKNDILYPVEVKKTAAPSQADVKRFKLLEKTGRSVAPGAILSLYEKVLPIVDRTISIPIGHL